MQLVGALRIFFALELYLFELTFSNLGFAAHFFGVSFRCFELFHYMSFFDIKVCLNLLLTNYLGRSVSREFLIKVSVFECCTLCFVKPFLL